MILCNGNTFFASFREFLVTLANREIFGFLSWRDHDQLNLSGKKRKSRENEKLAKTKEE